MEEHAKYLDQIELTQTVHASAYKAVVLAFAEPQFAPAGAAAASAGEDGVPARARATCDWRRALAALRQMQQRELTPDVATFTAVINACERSRQWEAALLLMEEMRRNGFEIYD